MMGYILSCKHQAYPIFEKWVKILSIHGGIRTHDLWIRSPTRYPLRYADLVTIDIYSEEHYIFITKLMAFCFLNDLISYKFGVKSIQSRNESLGYRIRYLERYKFI